MNLFESIKSQVKESYNNKKNELQDKMTFNKRKFLNTTISINDGDKRFFINNGKIYNFSDILECELIEDNNSVIKTGTGSLIGRTIVGSAFGGIGAIIGGSSASKKSSNICSKLDLKISINNLDNPYLFINFIDKPLKKKSKEYVHVYSEAQKLLSLFQVMINNK